MEKIKQFFETNKDWLIQVGAALLVAILAPLVFVRGRGRPRRGVIDLGLIGQLLQLGALGYAGYVIYKNWSRIKSSLGV